MPYSTDLRTRVVDAYQEGEGTMRELGERFKLDHKTVYDWVKLQRETGSVQPREHKGGAHLKLVPDVLAKINELLLEQNDRTDEEIQQLLLEKYGISLGHATINRAIHIMGWSRKKKTFHDPKQDEERVQQEREEFLEKVKDIDPEKMVFIDESGSQTNMAREYGRAPVGERAVGVKPLKGERINMLGALKLSGLEESILLQQHINGENFLFFVENYLVNILHPGDVVFLDNNWFHFVDGVEEAIRQAGATLLYLPPYSPELNPIEEFWSKVKNQLKTLAARTKELLYDAISSTFQSVTLADIKGWFQHAGYCSDTK